jgi:hypothetical protein
MGGPFKLKGMDFGNSPYRQEEKEKVFKGRTDILEKPTASLGPRESKKDIDKINKISNIESQIGDVKEALFNEEISKEKADAKIALLKKKLALLK